MDGQSLDEDDEVISVPSQPVRLFQGEAVSVCSRLLYLHIDLYVLLN